MGLVEEEEDVDDDPGDVPPCGRTWSWLMISLTPRTLQAHLSSESASDASTWPLRTTRPLRLWTCTAPALETQRPMPERTRSMMTRSSTCSLVILARVFWAMPVARLNKWRPRRSRLEAMRLKPERNWSRHVLRRRAPSRGS